MAAYILAQQQAGVQASPAPCKCAHSHSQRQNCWSELPSWGAAWDKRGWSGNLVSAHVMSWQAGQCPWQLQPLPPHCDWKQAKLYALQEQRPSFLHPSGKPHGVSRLPRWRSGKENVCQCRKYRRQGFHPWVGKIPWRREWQLASVFLPKKSYGQRSLVGYSPWGHKGFRHDWEMEHTYLNYLYNLYFIVHLL